MRGLAPIALAFLLAPLGAAADSLFASTGADLVPREKAEVKLAGGLRLRGEALDNLDLDRGLTPSGEAFFPVPLSSPNAQWLTHADMRLRADLAIYAPRGALAVKVRADLLDNLALGSLPEGFPAGSSTQRTPLNVLRLKRAWGEALTPLGLLAAGRMGNQWGLGMLANGGDCPDCDGGDSGDRIAFVTPIAGHLWSAAYDFSATGPLVDRRGGTRTIDVEPTAAVRTFTFAVLKAREPWALERRRRAGKVTFEYGGYLSHRTQENDVPVLYLPASSAPAIDPQQVMARGWTATAVDAWARLTTSWLRVEAEAALLLGSLDQASLIPGALLPDPVRSTQLGAAVESEVGSPEDALTFGLDLGYASGDPAPGFGAFPGINQKATVPGDLDGPQADVPRDNRVDNFRFSPDYRIDRILFREIIGTVTDAFYLRPHGRWRIAQAGPAKLTFSLAAIASWAVYAESTPGGRRPLGLELAPTLTYENEDGFSAALEHAVLIPFAGLDNPAQGLSAKPAQLLRLRLAYAF